jgi:hypothetical protein
MELYLVGVAISMVAWAMAQSGVTSTATANFVLVVGLLVFGVAALRTLWWLFSNLSTVARSAGEIAAKGANHVDTLKDAFKEGRNK